MLARDRQDGAARNFRNFDLEEHTPKTVETRPYGRVSSSQWPRD
jgi:hypothetical protein